MHEATLVRSLLAQAEAICRSENGLAIEEIRIETGPLSGVEPLLVESAFAEMASACGKTDIRLVIDEMPLLARCDRCGTVEVRLKRIACPDCGEANVRIIQGDEVRLLSVTIRQEAGCEAPT